MRKSSVQIVVRKNRPTPFTVKFREMGQRKTLAFKTRSEAEIFANTLKRSKRLPDDVMLNSSDLMAFMRLKSACEASGISLEAGVEKAISSLITPNDYINGGLSLAAALEKFVKTREALNSRSSTIADYITYIAKAQNFFGADRAIKTITKRDLDALLDTQERLSVKKALCVKLRIFFKYFRQKEWIDENVAEALTVESRRRDEENPTILTPEQTTRVFNSLPNDSDVLACYALWAFAGLRPEEVCPKDKKSRLEWSAINFNEHVITVCGSVSKVRKNRKLQNLPENLWRFLELTPPEKRIGAVCTKSYSTMRRIRRKIPLELPKDIFRHSFATYGYYKYDPKDLIVMMGHLRGFTTFEKHYMGLADRASSEKYFAIMPQK